MTWSAATAAARATASSYAWASLSVSSDERRPRSFANPGVSASARSNASWPFPTMSTAPCRASNSDAVSSTPAPVPNVRFSANMNLTPAAQSRIPFTASRMMPCDLDCFSLAMWASSSACRATSAFDAKSVSPVLSDSCRCSSDIGGAGRSTSAGPSTNTGPPSVEISRPARTCAST